MAKLFWSEYHKKLGEIAIGIVGTDALVGPEGAGYPPRAWQNVFLSQPGRDHLLRDQRDPAQHHRRAGLGLPKEPRVA